MHQSSNDLLYAVKLHLATNRRCPGSEQRCVAGLVRRDGDDRQTRQSGATLPDELLALAVVEIVIRQNQVVGAGRERTPGGSQTWNNRDAVGCQELPSDLLCKHCMVLKIQNVHGRNVAERSC